MVLSLFDILERTASLSFLERGRKGKGRSLSGDGSLGSTTSQNVCKRRETVKDKEEGE